MQDNASCIATTTDDVVFVGGGLAGLFCALKLGPREAVGWARRG